MLVKRALVVLILLPIGLVAIWLGGVVYAAAIALILALAAWEYQRLFYAGGLRPAGVLIVLSTLLLVVGRFINEFASADWMLSLVILASMAYHLAAYERGRDQAATDFGVTLGGALYFGWLGSYLISLRGLSEGMWWVLMVLPAIWFADVGAYLVGSRIGRRQLTARLSPKKTWEGYLGGIAVSSAATALLALGLQSLGAPAAIFTAGSGAILGFILATTSLLGDLGESMIKRQVGAKDSGHILPGHGGMFDRIDSWLWGVPIGFYVILWLFTGPI